MNSMERILATLGGKPVDRRAVVPVLSLYGARLTKCTTEQYYSDPIAYAAGQKAVRETFQPDAVFAPFAFAYLGKAFGSELHYFKEDAPNIRHHAINSALEWDKLVMPDPDTHPVVQFFRKAVQMMAADSKGQYPVVAVLPPPIDLPALIMGLDNWMETVLFDRPRAVSIVEKITPFFVRLANNLFADGAAFIVLPCGFVSPAIVTREIASTFSRPVLEKALARLKGPVVLHHIGACILPHLDLLTGIPPTVAFVVDNNDNLSKARKIIGPDAVLFGGVNGPNLARMSAAQVEKECLAILEERKSDPYFVLGTAGPDIPWNTPPENIHAILKASGYFARSGMR